MAFLSSAQDRGRVVLPGCKEMDMITPSDPSCRERSLWTLAHKTSLVPVAFKKTASLYCTSDINTTV